MDESVINGANIFFAPQFGLNTDNGARNASQNQWIFGLVNGAPYVCPSPLSLTPADHETQLCCGLISCWLTHPLNKWFGRRGAIFITAFISFASCIWQGVTNSWPHLFVARLVLGLGVGPKSATVPVYAAECAPAVIRGALVMMWCVRFIRVCREVRSVERDV